MGCSQERLHGFKAAMAKHAISINNEWIMEGDFEQSTGYAEGSI
jgi:DNA-binding LacI/PurR family transcriptional regulator